MSLFSSIAYPGTAEARGISLRGLAAFALALVLGTAVGAVMDSGEVSDASQASAMATTALPHDEFIRLNTTDMDHLSPAVTVTVGDPVPTIDSFLYWNTTALDSLVPQAGSAANNVTDEFLRWNIDSLEFADDDYSEPPSGPR